MTEKPPEGEEPETIAVHMALTECPHCGANLVGAEIPLTHREYFGGKTHGSRLIAIYDRDRDRTSHYECPDCRTRIERGPPADSAGQFRTTDVEIR